MEIILTENEINRFPNLSLEENVRQFIRQRRRQILVHSCLYYHLDENIVEDFVFDRWCYELVYLQEKYSKISEEVEYYNDFKNFDGSSGYYLPYKTPYILAKAKKILNK